MKEAQAKKNKERQDKRMQTQKAPKKKVVKAPPSAERLEMTRENSV